MTTRSGPLIKAFLLASMTACCTSPSCAGEENDQQAVKASVMKDAFELSTVDTFSVAKLSALCKVTPEVTTKAIASAVQKNQTTGDVAAFPDENGHILVLDVVKKKGVELLIGTTQLMQMAVAEKNEGDAAVKTSACVEKNVLAVMHYDAAEAIKSIQLDFMRREIEIADKELGSKQPKQSPQEPKEEVGPTLPDIPVNPWLAPVWNKI